MSRRTKIVLSDTPPSQSVPTNTGVGFLASIPNKGVHDPEAGPVRSIAAVEKRFGGRQSFSPFYDWAETFFREGGAELWVSPVRGPNPVKASLNIPGTVGTALVATALSAGDWANGATGGYTVEVINGPVNGATHRQLIVRFNAVEVGRSVEFDANTTVVGAVIDEVTITLGGGSGLPPVAAAANLAAGTLDRTNITQTQITAALDALSADLGPGNVAAPDWVTEASTEALLAHGEDRNRWAIGDVADTTSKSTLLAAANLVQGHADALAGELVGPWVTIRGTADGSVTSRSVPGSAFRAAKYAETDLTDGPNQAAAGRWGRASSTLVTGVKATFSDADAEELEDAGVNLIISRHGTVQVDGNRSLVEPLGTDRQWLQASNCRFRMALVAQLTEAAENFEHAQITRPTIAALDTALTGVMQRHQASLFGADDGSDPGFVVDTETVNTPTTIEANELHAQVGFRPAKGADLVQISLSKVGVADAIA
jgi:hypothetical protein